MTLDMDARHAFVALVWSKVDRGELLTHVTALARGIETLRQSFPDLNQTTGDWHRSTLLEIWALPGGLRSKRPPEAAKVTKFVTQLLFPSSRDLTGCHRSVRMSCG